VPPQEGFIKLNFNGASKGNPGKEGEGGVFRDHMGEVILVYASNLEYYTNKFIEIARILHSIEIAQKHGFQALEVEGDSQVLIMALRKIVKGVQMDRVSQQWNLSHGITELNHMVGIGNRNL
jgi:ribonuclease HI